MEKELEKYLTPTFYIDCNHPSIQDYSHSVIRSLAKEKINDPRQQAVALYYAVRDNLRYNPYAFTGGDDTFIASKVLAAGEGFCVPKAILLAALGRAAGIPTRLGFADVRNHLTSEKLKQLMQTDVFAFHGNTGFFLEGHWVKCTPAFNLSLCQKANTKALEFDGYEDSLFHPLDNLGNKHMEYLKDRGDFADFPKEEMMAAFQEVYGKSFANADSLSNSEINLEELAKTDFEKEVISE